MQIAAIMINIEMGLSHSILRKGRANDTGGDDIRYLKVENRVHTTHSKVVRSWRECGVMSLDNSGDASGPIQYNGKRQGAVSAKVGHDLLMEHCRSCAC
jgi:hypothetical protein